MTERKTLMRRLAAGVGAFALATVGFFAASTAAYAENGDGNGEPTPAQIAQIDKNTKGSIIVHKHVKVEDGQPLGTALQGVKFKVERVSHNGTPIDLSTAGGWVLAEQLFNDTGVPPLPTDFTSTQVGSEQETNSSGETTFDNLGIGVYLVTETDPGNNVIAQKAAPFLVAIPNPVDGDWIYNVHVYPKNVVSELNVPVKRVGEPDKKYEVGANIDWEIEVTVPGTDSGYKSFVISDNLASNLTFVEWKSIKVGSTTLGAGDYTVGTDNSVTLTPAGMVILNNAAATGEVTVSAVISTTVTSIPDNGVIANKATITINGTPKDTPDVTSNWGQIKVLKKSNVQGANVDGAVFELWNSDKSVKLAEGTISGGEYVFTMWLGNNDVKTGTFWLKETVAPQGHVLPADPWTGPIDVTAGETQTAKVSQEVTNHKPTGPTLPQTGSSATVIMMLVGLGLIGGAGALFAARRTRTSH